MKCFLTTMHVASRNNIGAYSIYEKIMQSFAEIEPLATTHYLYYIVSSGKYRQGHSSNKL